MQKTPVASRKTSKAYISSIDGLRAFAVLGVILYHFEIFENWIQGGFIGVDVFFVISGFLITRIIVGSLHSRFWIKDFYYHRVRRIFPALIFVISLTLLASLLLMTPYELKAFGKEILGAGTFSSNFIYLDDFGYFDKDATAKPFLHLWSLAIEEQFYLFWPLFIWAASKLRISLTKLISISILLSFSFCIYLSYNNQVLGFYSPATRGWELALGGLIALSKVELSGSLSTYLRCIGGGLLFAGFFFIDSTTTWPSALSLVPALGTAFLLIGSLNPESQSKILTFKPILYLGRISYPLYLLHWPTYSLYTISMGSIPNSETKIIMLGCCFLLAHLFFRVIENPIRNSHNFRKMIPRMVVAMIVISSIGVAISSSDGLTFRYPKPASDSNSQLISNQFVSTKFQDDSCVKQYGNERVKQYAWWFCRSNRNSPPTVLLWGNSYANHYFEGLSALGNIRNRSILSIGDCSVQRGTVIDKTNPCFGQNWFEQRDFVKDLVVKSKSLKYVIIAGLNENASAQDLADLRDVLTFLRDQDRKVIIFYPHIRPVQSIFSCLDRPIIRAKWNCQVSLDLRSDLNEAFSSSLKLTSLYSSNTYVFDPNSAFCDESSCKFNIEGELVLRDSASHLSLFGSKIVAREFSTWANEKIPSLASE